MLSIAVIGAGISGLTLARQLLHCADVTVFEKSRGVGGRIATRRIDGLQFDHGAQFVTARTPEFMSLLQAASIDGAVADWQPRSISLSPERKAWKRDWFEPHYVGQPGMTHLAKYLATDVETELNCPVEAVKQRDGQWWMVTASGERGPFDWLISTAPAPQTATLLSGVAAVTDFLEPVCMKPCIAFMIRFNDERPFPWQVIEARDSFLDWIADESSRPERPDGAALTVHADPLWSEGRFKDDDAQLTAAVVDELTRLTGIDGNAFKVLAIKRWRYARVIQVAEAPCLLLPEQQLGVCGDFCVGGRVEAAFISALTLSRQLEPLLTGDDRRFQVSDQRGQARGKVRYVEGNKATGCRFLSK